MRYRGARFGVEGMLCATCRARALRHQKARDQGFEPGKVGRRPTAAAAARRLARRGKGKRRSEGDEDDNEDDASCRVSLSPEQVAENLRAVREEGERNGSRPRGGDSLPEIRQRWWAALAAAERKLVVEARRRAMSRG